VLRSKFTSRINRWSDKVLFDAPDQCWLWVGATKNGYGLLTTPHPNRRQIPAHRVAYELFVGPIPDGLFVCHTCDNPPCVNPAHLYAGTAADNSADCVSRGRHRSPIAGRPACRNGHLYGPDTPLDYRGFRACPICVKEKSRRWRAGR